MKMRFVTAVLTAGILLAACSRTEESPELRRSVVAGRIDRLPDTVTMEVTVFAQTPFSRHMQRFPLDSRRPDFMMDFDLLFGQQILVALNGQTTVSCYLSPGDSVYLDLHADAILAGDSLHVVDFSGDHAEMNRQLQAWTAWIYPQLFQAWNYSQSYEAFMQDVRTHYTMLTDKLEAYNRLHPMLDELKQWAAVDLKFCMSNTIDGGPSYTMRSLYDDPFFDLTDPANMQSLMFQSHLDGYIGTWMSILRARIGLLAAPDELARAVVRQICTLPSGWVRDALLYRFASGIISAGNGEAFHQAVPDFRTHFRHEQALQAVADAEAAYAYAVSPDVRIDSLYQADHGECRPIPMDTLFFAYLSACYPGKVIYLDFWAAWCDACEYEMENARELHAYFADRSDEVVFVHCCLLSDVASFMDAQPRIDGHPSYYLSRNGARQLFSKYPIETFPTYFIVDQEGTIVQDQAPYPSAWDDVVDALESLL